MKKFLKCFIFYFLSLLFLECLYKVVCYNIFFDDGFIYMTLFSIVYSFFMTIITMFLPKKLSYPVSLIIFGMTTILFIAEFIFTYVFGLTFSIYSITMADQAFDFLDIIYRVIKEQLLPIILFMIPFILFILLHKKLINQKRTKYLWKYVLINVLLYFGVLIILTFNKDGIYSPYNLYYKTHAPTVTVNTLGLMTEFRLDISRFIFGFSPSIVLEENDEPLIEEEARTEYNKLDYNFDFSDDSKISSVSSYLKSQKITNKNSYTGIFEGKNLIYILAEGFNSIAVDEEVTPTLYKLVNTGLVFDNYYSPEFMSTTGGEFQFSTGLIPNQKSLNKWKEGKVTFPYALGNVFNNLGYDTRAYHNWTYTYYKRHKTMPNLGYTNYKACGNGLEKMMNCKIWPPSDLEMFTSTLDEYIDLEHFMVHYITVSGHAEYNFDGNNMARKNKKLVDNLPYSNEIKAYLATQIELDKALEYLLNKLEEKGILDDTVIVLSGDHYPYTLSLDAINEKSTYKRDLTFEVNNSNLIIYNTGLENIHIDKLASSIDVIPTILNMFGVDYDSRLLLGKDIMSEHDSIVIFSDHSWITEKGRFNAKTRAFVPNDGEDADDEYVAKMNQEVQNRVNVGTHIVESNYYQLFFEHQTIEKENSLTES